MMLVTYDIFNVALLETLLFPLSRDDLREFNNIGSTSTHYASFRTETISHLPVD